MPIEIQWDNAEKTVVLQTLWGEWTLDDYHEMVDTSVRMLASVPHEVCIICDATQTTLMPTHMMSGARYAIKKLPNNQGKTIFVGTTMFMKALINIAQKVAPHVSHIITYADDVEAARQVIRLYHKEKTL